VEIWPPGRWKREGKAKPAIQVITGSEAAKPAIPESGGHPNFNLNPNPENLSTKGKATATSKPAIAVITDFGVGLSGKESENSKAVGSASNCEPYRELIELGLSRDRNAMAIWQDLVSDYGFQGGYQSVRRFAYKLRGAQVPHARAVILTAPGEEGQVDYGSGPMVREPKSGKYRRTRLFVLTLGYSRKAVRLLVFRSSTRIWAELHEKAFRRLGGRRSEERSVGRGCSDKFCYLGLGSLHAAVEAGHLAWEPPATEFSKLAVKAGVVGSV